MSAHTPGPWFCNGPWLIQAAGDHPLPHYVAEVKRPHGCDNKTREANAELIAAAPDLLAALQRLSDVARCPAGWSKEEHATTLAHALLQAQSAITKATP